MALSPHSQKAQILQVKVYVSGTQKPGRSTSAFIQRSVFCPASRMGANTKSDVGGNEFQVPLEEDHQAKRRVAVLECQVPSGKSSMQLKVKSLWNRVLNLWHGRSENRGRE